MDVAALRQASKDVEVELGREVLVESAAVAGSFEMFTKLADATGKESAPAAEIMFFNVVMAGVNRAYSYFASG